MWAAGLEPGQAFDASRVEPAFLDLIMTGTLPEGDALVPGCGRGYAVAALGSAERKVTGLEISATAKAAADAFLSTAKAGDGSAASEHCTVWWTTSSPIRDGTIWSTIAPFSAPVP